MPAQTRVRLDRSDPPRGRPRATEEVVRLRTGDVLVRMWLAGLCHTRRYDAGTYELVRRADGSTAVRPH